MKKRTVISNVPIRLPFQSTILYTFLLYHFNVDGLWWGIFITLYSILWIVAIAVKWNEEKIDLDKEDEKSPAKSKFQQKLNKLMSERGQKEA